MPPKQKPNQDPTELQEIKDFLDTNFKNLETRLNSVEQQISGVDNQIKAQHGELVSLVNKVESTAKKALSVAESNSETIKTNTDKIETCEFETDQLKEQVNNLNQEVKELKEELEDSKNRSMRKTLIFKNIPLSKSKENWEECKTVLVNEIKKVMPSYSSDEILSKIERAHRAKENKHIKIPAIIAKFTNWSFSEAIKDAFIREISSSNGHPIYVSQMYTPALTARRNQAMITRKELKSNDSSIQAYVKFPAVLMIKKEGERKYSPYAEY